ncbi:MULTISPECIES: ketopantoate reductase family protein [unclassified Aeromicrobium]|uniref:ketopantoate reductase family protein n=1 Tax=unclassified Aeromicrobium TaxID=2633570 RepID=UPI00396B0237
MSNPTPTAPDRRIIVIGPGATGGTIAAELHLHGARVVAVARGAELESLRSRGLIYHTSDGTRTVPLDVVGGPAELTLTDRDVLLLATKSQDAEAALRDWAWAPVQRADGSRGRAGTDLPLVTVQNGLNTDRSALRWFSHIVAGSIYCPGGKEKVGEIENYGGEKRVLLWLGHYLTRGIDDELRELVDALSVAPTLGFQAVEDITAIKASKLSYNTINGLEPVFAPSDLRDEVKEGLRQEALRVFAAIGITPLSPIESGISLWPHSVLEGDIAGRTRPGNSTLQSYLRHAPLETDYLNGEIVLLGRLHGVPTPLNEAMQVLTAEAVEQDLPPGAKGDDEIRALLDRAAAPVA